MADNDSLISEDQNSNSDNSEQILNRNNFSTNQNLFNNQSRFNRQDTNQDRFNQNDPGEEDEENSYPIQVQPHQPTRHRPPQHNRRVQPIGSDDDQSIPDQESDLDVSADDRSDNLIEEDLSEERSNDD